MDTNTFCQEPAWGNNPHLSTERLTPLEERCSQEKPHLLAGLLKLKDLIGAEKFDRYINPIPNFNQNGKMMLFVAGNELRRSHIVRECIPAIKVAFGADTVRVIGGGSFIGINSL